MEMRHVRTLLERLDEDATKVCVDSNGRTGVAAAIEGNQCWYCGDIIPEIKYYITERLLDYGHYSGRTLSTPIHKSCYSKAKAEGYTQYFIRGLEEV